MNKSDDPSEPVDTNLAQKLADSLSGTAASFLIDAAKHPGNTLDLYFAEHLVFKGGGTKGHLTPLGAEVLSRYCHARKLAQP